MALIKNLSVAKVALHITLQVVMEALHKNTPTLKQTFVSTSFELVPDESEE